MGLARPEIVPGAVWQIDRPVPRPGTGHRRDEDVVAPEELARPVQRLRIVGIVEDERPHQRQALHVCLPGKRVGVRHQAVAEPEIVPADRLDLRPVGPGQVHAPASGHGSGRSD